ncbi:hypothetical protein [Bifidobacterium crudilactis]|jgi:hypothetical protein|uniref:hypothetical protein n=1 Tax=Bifidobacterium crudilactis TaxID=327277 RepID=UPI00068C8820|nr:hypothetical protein [Bifidobacterium crudilactis]MCI2148633.1 hypothetical protein [Bifidobacterium crudilactis]MCI2158348.1 hypothetical protein [Bifidobacterium crudilactis]
MADIDLALVAEQQQLETFIRLYKVPGLDIEVMVNHRWNMQDMLAHILAWHESFAHNLHVLAEGKPAEPPWGTLRDVNREGVLALRGVGIPRMLRRLRKAQRIIELHIHHDSITLIPYRRLGTSYTRQQHLDVVRGHINQHFWELLDVYVAAKG